MLENQTNKLFVIVMFVKNLPAVFLAGSSAVADLME